MGRRYIGQRDFNKLPLPLKNFIEFIEKSDRSAGHNGFCGPDREETIFRS